MIHQLNPTIAVLTPLGDAEALLIIDYGVNVNTIWVCRMKGGYVKHFYSDDIRVYDNPMNGKGWDVKDDFPERKIEDETDIRFDFGKEQLNVDKPKTTIGAIDAKDLADFTAKMKEEEKKKDSDFGNKLQRIVDSNFKAFNSKRMRTKT